MIGNERRARDIEEMMLTGSKFFMVNFQQLLLYSILLNSESH
jgi:hypothetical protein